MTQILHLVSVDTGSSRVVNLLFLLISVDSDDAQGLENFLLIHMN